MLRDKERTENCRAVRMMIYIKKLEGNGAPLYKNTIKKQEGFNLKQKQKNAENGWNLSKLKKQMHMKKKRNEKKTTQT